MPPMLSTSQPSPGRWRWCGQAHHFIAADSCRFHLTTFVANGQILVSSVGDYYYNDDRQTLGAAPDSWYETMVFQTDPDNLYEGCPMVTSWSELDGIRYATAEEANNGHLALCRTYDLWTPES